MITQVFVTINNVITNSGIILGEIYRFFINQPPQNWLFCPKISIFSKKKIIKNQNMPLEGWNLVNLWRFLFEQAYMTSKSVLFPSYWSKLTKNSKRMWKNSHFLCEKMKKNRKHLENWLEILLIMSWDRIMRNAAEYGHLQRHSSSHFTPSIFSPLYIPIQNAKWRKSPLYLQA